MWVIGGYSYDYGCFNDVWYSTDGITWTQATGSAQFPARFGHTSVVFDNKMWVIGGYGGVYPGDCFNDVWYSTDGITWTQATGSAQFPARHGHTSVVYNNKMWVIGGGFSNNWPYYKNDVWYSADGVTWTQATASAQFPIRSGHTSVVFNNKMWVIGGDYLFGVTWKDIWYSTDGVIWTRAIDYAGFPEREGHTSVVYNGKMWVIGGHNSSDLSLNDVWYSFDGIIWTQATASADFPFRYHHTSVVYNNKMWVIGGICNYNDVWYSSSGLENLVVNFYQEGMLPSPKVSGACCDGEVIIILLIQSNKDGEVEVSIVGNDTEGKFGRLIGSISPTEPVIASIVDGIGQAWYQVPSSYPDANTTFNFRFKESGSSTYIDAGQKTLELSKPPVVMLHGIWSDAKTWETMTSVLKSNGFQFLNAYNYKKTNDQEFNVNRNVAKKAIRITKDRTLKKGYAVKKVDVIVHSMGGILTRYYIEDLGDILYQEDIRKFITIGTPHSGSEIANLLVIGRPITSALMLLAGKNINNGAVDDLQVTSYAIDNVLNAESNLTKNTVFSHSIVGASPTIAGAGWSKDLWKVLQCVFPSSVPNLILGTPNDSVVGAISQRGGLDGDYTQEISVLSHTTETEDSDVLSAVLNLLNEPPAGSTFSSFDPQGFVNPADLNFLGFSLPKEKPISFNKSLGEGTVTITSPLSGSVFAPGDTINVSVETTGTVNKVLIICNFDGEIVETPPYTYSLNIPLDYLGELIIGAAGINDDEFLDDDYIIVSVVTSSTVDNINLIPEDYLPLYKNETYEILVLGAFSDGITRDITSPLTGSIYMSSDTSIATVSVDGIIETKDIGTTNIIVTNNVSKELEVEVLEGSMSVYVKIFELYE